MRSKPRTPDDTRYSVKDPQFFPGAHRTGNGVVFFDAEERHQILRVASRKLRRTVVAVVLGATLSGVATVIALDWFSPDRLLMLATSNAR